MAHLNRKTTMVAAFLLVALAMAITAPVVREALARHALDRAIETFMAAHGIPGASLAVLDGDRVVVSRQYGLADVDRGVPVSAGTLFRVASLSKPITAAAVMTLVGQGAITLDGRIADILRIEGGDPRLRRITVQHLLQHRGGWDRARTHDPMFAPEAVSCAGIAEGFLQTPLQFAPGTRYAYSNFGYCLLSLVIERVADQPYEAAVRTIVPGMDGMRIGKREQAPDEAVAHACAERCQPADPSFNIEAMAANGGWIATALDFARLPVPDQRQAAPPVPGDELPSFYGLGWRVWPKENGQDLTHYGAMEGSFAVAIRTADGLSIAALFNARPRNDLQAFALLYDTLPRLGRQLAGQGE